LVSARAVVADNRIRVIGGAPSVEQSGASTAVFLSNGLLASGGVVTSWTTHSQALPSPLVYHDAEVIQGIIYVTGGTDSATFGSGVALDNIYAMDPAVGIWVNAGTSMFFQPVGWAISGTPLAIPAYGMRAIAVGGLTYVLGEYEEIYCERLNECRIHDPAADGFADPAPFTGDPCSDIINIYLDADAGGNCRSTRIWTDTFSALVVTTNPTGERVSSVEFNYQVSTTDLSLLRIGELLPRERTTCPTVPIWQVGTTRFGFRIRARAGGEVWSAYLGSCL
jgi:hypothetical protein